MPTKCLFIMPEGLELLQKTGVEIKQEGTKNLDIPEAQEPPQPKETLLGKMIGGNPECRHHWIIEPADGPISRGKCDLCKGISYFGNSLDINPGEHPWISPGVL